jgi:hypothetical protein
MPAGADSAIPTDVNDAGVIVGARRALGYTPTGSGWLYSEALGVVDLMARRAALPDRIEPLHHRVRPEWTR